MPKLVRLTEDRYEFDADTDICYSPDDGGWYATRYTDGAVSSSLYGAVGDCDAALRRSAVEWELP